MPLRDDFRPPVENEHSWDELHGMWPAVIVQQLFPILPEGFVAAPRVHLGAAFEIDVSRYQRAQPARQEGPGDGEGGVAVAVAAWAPPKPTLTLETELPDQDEYEVRVYDARHRRPGMRPLLDTWFYPMVLGQALPTLPIWLDGDLGVLLDLETSYEETCRALRIA